MQKQSTSIIAKLKGAVGDGIVNFSFSQTEAKFQFNFSKSQSNTSCDGSFTITLKSGPNIYINQLKPPTEPQVSVKAVQEATYTVANGGAIAVGIVLLFKLIKGVVGSFVGGPAKTLLGYYS